MAEPAGSRQDQILTLLLNSPAGMNIEEIACELAISRTAVKQHLSALENKQWITEASLNSSTGGRPARSYQLTRSGINRLPKQYPWFANLLLDELATQMDMESMEQMMWQMGVNLANSLLPSFMGKTAEQKQLALVKLMQDLGYHAELNPGQPTTIKASNCVYHDLAQQHPEICQFDRALISTLLTTPIVQTACMAKKDCICSFNIDQDSRQIE